MFGKLYVVRPKDLTYPKRHFPALPSSERTLHTLLFPSLPLLVTLPLAPPSDSCRNSFDTVVLPRPRLGWCHPSDKRGYFTPCPLCMRNCYSPRAGEHLFAILASHHLRNIPSQTSDSAGDRIGKNLRQALETVVELCWVL